MAGRSRQHGRGAVPRGACVGAAMTAWCAGAVAQPEGGALSAVETDSAWNGAGAGGAPRRELARLVDAASLPDAGQENEGAGVDGGSAEEAGEGGEAGQRLHVWTGVDLATAYLSRGFVWEDSGLVVQPWADVWLDVWQNEWSTVSLTAGTWSSFHSQATDAGTSDNLREAWYELDLYAGAALECGAWTIEGRYCWYTSPSDAWDTIEEASLSAAVDDSGWLGAWAMQPHVLLAVETGAVANDGYDNGLYLELGVEPGFGLESLGATGRLGGVRVSFPVSVGLSLDDYYESQDEHGEYADVFGYASGGVTLAVPLAGEGGVLSGSDGLGSWGLTLGVQAVWLGDAAASFNEGDGVVVVGTLGVGVEF